MEQHYPRVTHIVSMDGTWRLVYKLGRLEDFVIKDCEPRCSAATSQGLKSKTKALCNLGRIATYPVQCDMPQEEWDELNRLVEEVHADSVVFGHNLHEKSGADK